MQSHLRGALLSLAAFAFYATHDVVVKYLGGHYSPFQTMFFAGLMGFPLITILLLGDRRDGTLIPRHPWWTVIRTVSAVVTGAMGFYAFSVLPMATCYAIFFAMPLLITLMAIPMLGEKIGLRRGMAVIVGLIAFCLIMAGLRGMGPLDRHHPMAKRFGLSPAAEILADWEGWRGRLKLLVPPSEKASVGLAERQAVAA